MNCFSIIYLEEVLQRHYKWYKLWTRFKVRGLDGYAVSNAVGRRKKGNGKLVCHGFEYNRIHSPLIEKNDG